MTPLAAMRIGDALLRFTEKDVVVYSVYTGKPINDITLFSFSTDIGRIGITDKILDDEGFDLYLWLDRKICRMKDNCKNGDNK